MSSVPQIRIPATYLRGGTSKGVFFRLEDLPERARVPGKARDALLQRVIGSPDPYGKQIDGMGGATSSTSKTVIVSRSAREGHDVDYLFGQVAIDSDFVDWSGNCGNLSAAVGPFAIASGLVEAGKLPRDGLAALRVELIDHIIDNDGQTRPALRRFFRETHADTEVQLLERPAAQLARRHPAVSSIQHEQIALIVRLAHAFVSGECDSR